MNLSVEQTIVASVCAICATVLAVTGTVDSTAVAMGLIALAANALGYVNGKRNRHAPEPPALDGDALELPAVTHNARQAA